LSSIVKEVHGAAQAAGQTGDGMADLYVLLGHEHMVNALGLVDRGVVCLNSNGRSLFRVKSATQSCDDDDVCYCLLPGPYCSRCMLQEPCIHTTAALVAVAQSRFATEALPPKELAVALFSITWPAIRQSD
ncbi:hypothetical protein GGI00_006960, partial [Coemansia sp. RSA 2681]